MADNVDITAGDGTGVVAADEIQVDGTHTQGVVQFVKLVDGTLNGTGSVRVNQAAKANALTVAPASDISDATYIGDVKFGEALPAGTNAIGKLAANSGVDIGDVTLTAGTAAIGKLAANTGVDIGDVDVTSVIPGTAATNLGKAEDAGHTSGDVGVMALTVRKDTAAALGTTDVDYQPLITDASGRLHIAPLVAGSAAIGKLAANTGVDIGDVDVTSIIPLTGATNLGKARDVACGANDVGVMALAVRDDTLTTLTPADGDYAPLRLSSTGQLHVIDANITACNTGAVVISSGTVTTVSTVTSLSQLGGQAINLGEGVIATGTQRITLATDDDAVASLGIIDDWNATHASAASADGPQIMGAGYSTALPTDVGADADAARICTDRHGRILRGVMPQNFQATFTSADAQAATPVKAKTADRKMYILSLVVSVDTAMSVQFQDDTGPTVLIEGMYFAANGGAHLTWPAEAPLVVNTNEDFDVITSGAGNISVTITGYLAV